MMLGMILFMELVETNLAEFTVPFADNGHEPIVFKHILNAGFIR